jgi:hypothetical protein
MTIRKLTDVSKGRSVFIFGMNLLLAKFMIEDEDTLYPHPLIHCCSPSDKYLTFLKTVYLSFQSYIYCSCGEELHVEFDMAVATKG